MKNHDVSGLGLGIKARQFLDEQGFVARTPATRSSDYGLCLGNPFVYYIARRLGLVPTLGKSVALNRGGWFHHRMGMFDHLDPGFEMRRILRVRQDELRAAAELAGRNPDPIVEAEERDMLMACSWWESACTKVPISVSHGSLLDYLSQPCWRVLGREVALVNVGTYPSSIAQIDLLLYNTFLNTLWLFDGKTCTGSPKARLATCPLEFQTHLYTNTAQALLDQGVLQAHYNLPVQARLGGMIHAAIQKCELQFGELDRPFTEHQHELTRGPRKGQIEIRREYEDLPSYNLYLQRTRDWYMATGLHTHRAAKLADDPPVNLSFSWAANVMGPDGLARYRKMLAYVENHALADAWPENFLVDADAMRGWKDPSPYLPFALMPVHAWPSIVQVEGFAQVNRDDILPTPCDKSCILETSP